MSVAKHVHQTEKKYVVIQNFKQFLMISVSENVLVESECFCLQNKICSFLKQGIICIYKVFRKWRLFPATCMASIVKSSFPRSIYSKSLYCTFLPIDISSSNKSRKGIISIIHTLSWSTLAWESILVHCHKYSLKWSIRFSSNSSNV